MGSKIGIVLQKSLTLDSARAWIEAFDPTLQREIIIIWIQKEQIFTQGIDKYGNIIGLYSATTEQFTEGRKKAGTKFDLFESGDFFASMYIMVLADEIIIDADSSKMENKDWWRNAILGLTDENIKKLQERVKVKYLEFARRILGVY